MRQFSGKVRLGGSLHNEVPKDDLTVPQIIVLRAIHGSDGVADIKEVAPVKRTDDEERNRLAGLYGAAISGRAEIVGGLGALIGFSGPLPDKAAGVPLPSEAKKAKTGKAEEKPAEEPDTDTADEPELSLEA